MNDKALLEKMISLEGDLMSAYRRVVEDTEMTVEQEEDFFNAMVASLKKMAVRGREIHQIYDGLVLPADCMISGVPRGEIN